MSPWTQKTRYKSRNLMQDLCSNNTQKSCFVASVDLNSKYLSIYSLLPSYLLLLPAGRYAGCSWWQGVRGASLLCGWQGDQPQHLGEVGQYWETYVSAAAKPREHPWRKLGHDEEDQGQREEEQVCLSDKALLTFSWLEKKDSDVVPKSMLLSTESLLFML